MSRSNSAGTETSHSSLSASEDELAARAELTRLASDEWETVSLPDPPGTTRLAVIRAALER